MKLRDVGEFGLIDRISRKSRQSGAVRIGIGDDAAAIETTAGFLSLVTTDMLVEGVHFDPAYSDPFTLGKKSLAVNLSDMAAMGGIPRYFLLSLAIPAELPVEFVDSFIDGIVEMGAGFGLSLIGGDTSSSPGGLVVSVTLLGEQSPELVVTRSGARPRDLVCVTGTLGDSAMGLALLRKGIRGGKTVKRHLDPVPRVREGVALAEGRVPSAMIDISDGLLADLGHILDLSGVGARLFLEKLPLSDEFLAGHKHVGGDPFSLSLGGGEDYELLFTTPPDKIPEAQAAMGDSGVRCTVIGEITASAGLSLVDAEGAEYTQGRRGYNHFSD